MALISGSKDHQGSRHRQELLDVASVADAGQNVDSREQPGSKALNDGIVAGVQSRRAVKLTADAKKIAAAVAAEPKPAAGGIEVAFRSQLADLGRPLRQQRLDAGSARPDDQAGLGQRGADQPGDGASDKGLNDGDIVTLSRGSVKLEAAVMIQPGHADNAVTIALGYGRTQCGRVGKDVGFNANLIRTTDALLVRVRRSTIAATGETLRRTRPRRSAAIGASI